MSSYYCLLGNTPELSTVELQAILGESALDLVSFNVAKIELESDEKARHLMSIAGGVVKITSFIEDVTGQNPDQITERITDVLATRSDKVTFAIGEWSRDHLPVIDAAQIKQQLQKQDVPARYIESKRQGLSAAVLLHKKNITEIMVLNLSDQIVLAQTVAVQDIDAWTDRDRAKPYANRQKGMLPPKVARMMLNLAIGADIWASLKTATPINKTIYDPFCGTGTVLLEAAEFGARLVGSDLDPESVAGTRRNLEWWQTTHQAPREVWLGVGDVTNVHVPEAFIPDAIVTEPFLGKQTPREVELPNMFRGLEKMYTGAFKHWQQLLPLGAKIVIIFPVVDAGGQRYSMQRLIDKLPDFGYTITSGFVEYHRPQAIVGRQIAVITRTA